MERKRSQAQMRRKRIEVNTRMIEEKTQKKCASDKMKKGTEKLGERYKDCRKVSGLLIERVRKR